MSSGTALNCLPCVCNCFRRQTESQLICVLVCHQRVGDCRKLAGCCEEKGGWWAVAAAQHMATLQPGAAHADIACKLWWEDALALSSAAYSQCWPSQD